MSKQIQRSWVFLKDLFLIKLRYMSASLVATAVDYIIYGILSWQGLSPVAAHIPSFTAGMVTNFLLQKRYVFVLQRKVSTAFLLAVAVSIGGLFLSTLLIGLLVRLEFFHEYHFLAKVIASGLVFFYNFYLKRYVFEKRFF
jgi:putative flippase GtrA